MIYEYQIAQHRTQIYYNSIFIFGLKIWNNLDKNVIMVGDIYRFKRSLTDLINTNYFD